MSLFSKLMSLGFLFSTRVLVFQPHEDNIVWGGSTGRGHLTWPLNL